MQHERITLDPNVMLGKPCIRGTRITVEHILRQLGGGMTATHIVSGHPRLAMEDVAAAQAFAADVLAMPSIRAALAGQDAIAG
jgi:uncharacterized protein (DUF433 family)